ncbi:large conductance mechanosensitive channel protein MscL [Candidatus Liberibacter asiaticus]|uniref:Large-conductance mechanosensitive channel n=2 Tax=Liberibacter asiaticus TaxID=34021 RepID=C6XFL7_LIBAP|nr:large conductance mechanosensitive channel protein MscL [Candidatus Liberibacter asiaticus]ACT57170.1 large conductance mechanosensitive channel protein [Candidatus Liberibacter asiaticus str. psy62]AGH16867.1 large conductance mechanosensitive channel protein [Candidatus Liberibacter asiaticus str. gxpsy]ALK07223.1 large conductance mechanosensitive channel protein MscL [Candidatus Liberibacter asiaticus]ASK52706.1 large-conductance mechanosensitive channel protein [Candidatus Liberibacter 
MFQGTPVFNEFKKFIARGNVIDLSVGIIIGGAFNRVVQSIVEDIMMPLVGCVMGNGTDFSNYFLPLSSEIKSSLISEARKQGAVFAYGSFASVLVNFFILAGVVFVLIQFMNKLVKQTENVKNPPAEVQLLTEIRDLLQKN